MAALMAEQSKAEQQRDAAHRIQVLQSERAAVQRGRAANARMRELNSRGGGASPGPMRHRGAALQQLDAALEAAAVVPLLTATQQACIDLAGGLADPLRRAERLLRDEATLAEQRADVAVTQLELGALRSAVRERVGLLTVFAAEHSAGLVGLEMTAGLAAEAEAAEGGGTVRPSFLVVCLQAALLRPIHSRSLRTGR